LSRRPATRCLSVAGQGWVKTCPSGPVHLGVPGATERPGRGPHGSSRRGCRTGRRRRSRFGRPPRPCPGGTHQRLPHRRALPRHACRRQQPGLVPLPRDRGLIRQPSQQIIDSLPQGAPLRLHPLRWHVRPVLLRLTRTRLPRLVTARKPEPGTATGGAAPLPKHLVASLDPPRRVIRRSSRVRHLDPQDVAIIRVRQIPRPVRADHPEPSIREVDQAFQVARLPKQPVDMPHRDPLAGPAAGALQQPLEAGAAHADLPRGQPVVQLLTDRAAVPLDRGFVVAVLGLDLLQLARRGVPRQPSIGVEDRRRGRLTCTNLRICGHTPERLGTNHPSHLPGAVWITNPIAQDPRDPA
jgi:hypothetical protein